MEQSKHQSEIGEVFFLHHGTEVELDIAEFDEACTVPEESEGEAVSNESIEVFGEVEVFLDESMRGQARPAGFAFFVEAVVKAHDMDGEGAARGVVMADIVGLFFDDLGFAGELGVVFEKAEKRDDPEFTGFAGAGIALGDEVDVAFKDTPLVLCIRPGAGDFVFDLDAGLNIEIDGVLTFDFTGCNPIQNVGSKNRTFNSYSYKWHSNPTFLFFLATESTEKFFFTSVSSVAN